MGLLYDFSHEETLLQYNGRKLGIIVDRTPKCHCEIAGEGIEYSWGKGKNKYRGLPIKDKKTKAKFEESIRKCIGRQTITTDFVRNASRRARQYMLAYKALKEGGDVLKQFLEREMKNQDSKYKQDSNNNNKVDRATPIKLEKLLTVFKSHRCAMDFDHKFILEEN